MELSKDKDHVKRIVLIELERMFTGITDSPYAER